MPILVVNAGSTKTAAVAFADDDPRRVAETTLADPDDLRGFVDRIGGPSAVAAVGHRVVHGGAEFADAVRVTADVKNVISRFAPLAPLHNPPALRLIEVAEALLPGVPQIAAFDTAYFAALPPEAHVEPVPYEWYADWGVRRFGFHGISHRSVAERTPARRLISCHLGGGCSVTAIRDGKPLATTMGFTPEAGVMMGSRPGSLDPGLMLYLLRQRGLTADQLDDAFAHSLRVDGRVGRVGRLPAGGRGRGVRERAGEAGAGAIRPVGRDGGRRHGGGAGGRRGVGVHGRHRRARGRVPGQRVRPAGVPRRRPGRGQERSRDGGRGRVGRRGGVPRRRSGDGEEEAIAASCRAARRGDGFGGRRHTRSLGRSTTTTTTGVERDVTDYLALYPYGHRDVPVYDAACRRVRTDMVPSTLEQVLHPKETDPPVANSVYADDIVFFVNAFKVLTVGVTTRTAEPPPAARVGRRIVGNSEKISSPRPLSRL